MLPSSTSSPLSGLLSPEKSSQGGRPQGGTHADEFSQEYEKHVKTIESREPPRGQAEATTRGGGKRDEPSGASPGEGKPVATAEGADGKSLPLSEMRQMAGLLETEASEPPLEDETALDAQLAAAPTEGELPLDGSLADAALATIALPLHAAPQATLGHNGLSVAADGEASLADDGVLPAEEEGRAASLVSLLGRPAKEGAGAGLPARGDQGFEALLNTPGRVNNTAAAIDTVSPSMPPLSGQTASLPPTTPLPLAITLATPLHQANWGQAMAERVVWLTNAHIQEAEIQLHPRELGPIGVKVSLHHDQASVSFVVQHAATREALEAALPRLREMFAENGLQLGHSDVSQHAFKGRDGQGGGDGGSPQGGERPLEGEPAQAAEESLHGVAHIARTGVDTFV